MAIWREKNKTGAYYANLELHSWQAYKPRLLATQKQNGKLEHR